MYQIVTDGSWDMGSERAEKLGVRVIPFMITMDGEHYQKEVEEIEVRSFYKMMAENPKVFPKTSLPAMTDYEAAFEEYASKGIDIICFTISSKFSGSYNAAVMAKEDIEEKYPDVRITILDSTMATLMQGLMIKEMVSYQRSGADYDAFIQRFQEIRDSAHIFFTVENMDYLIHGGRVGKVAGISANILNLRPMILMKEGELFPIGLARGRKQSREKAIHESFEYIMENGNDPCKYAWMVGYGLDEKEGAEFSENLRKKLKDRWPEFDEEIVLGQIGATIGVHTGPYPLGLGIIEKACVKA